MPMLEVPSDLAEWLADQANIFGVPEGSFDHDADCFCRICWTLDVERRIYNAVANAKQLSIPPVPDCSLKEGNE